MKKRVAFVGWRGFVGSVLMAELEREMSWRDKMEAYFLSTSQQGNPCPIPWSHNRFLEDAWDLNLLKEMDIVLTCQGSDYTQKIHPSLRGSGGGGYWIDSASFLRLHEDSAIILEPVNSHVIDRAIEMGRKDFVGGNCSVSLMLMALGGLFKEGLVEWVHASTYQAASGAGARALEELLKQVGQVGTHTNDLLTSDQRPLIKIEKKLTEMLKQEPSLAKKIFKIPLAMNLIPWIDQEMPTGQSREEWKGQVETNKILQTQKTIPIDGTCVRVGVMRCHSQTLLVKLNKEVSLGATQDILRCSNQWIEIVPNTQESTLNHLHPLSISGTAKIPVGRMRHLSLGKKYLNIFTCGDQLLWGAALPLLCMLKKLIIGP